MADPQPKTTRQLPPLEIPPDLEAIYVNLVRITHSPSEMVIDFARMLPGMPSTEVKSRILMSPLSAKLFFRALGENLSKFEANFGEIKIPGTTTLAEHLFRAPKK